MEDTTGTHQHGSLSDSRKVVFHFKVFNAGIFVKDLLQEFSQLWNVPLTATQLEKDALLRTLRKDGKHLIESMAGLQNSHLGIQHDQRLLYGLQNSLRKIPGCLQQMLCSHISESHDNAVNVVVHSPVRHH